MSAAIDTQVPTVPVLIGGRWREGRAERFGPVYNPSTGKVIARVPLRDTWGKGGG